MPREEDIEILRQQLAEAHATLDAIRNGQVDAVLVDLGTTREVFTLEPADLPYREFIERMAEGALSLGEDGLILYANRFFGELVNVDREALLGQSFQAYLSECCRSAVYAAMASPGRTSLGAVLKLANGATLPVRLAIAPGSGPKGRRLSVVVSDQRVAHELAHEREAHGAALAQIDAKDRFLAVLGHELRNPLAALASSVDLLSGSFSSPTSGHERVLRGMNRQISQLRSLIDDLLDLSRVAHGKIRLKKEVVALEDLLEEAVATARDLLSQKGHELVVEPFDSSVCVLGDRTRLEQVFSNLLSNAVKYTPPAGRIFVTANLQQEDLVVEVRDSGVGLDQEHIERIFEPFVQLENEGSGGLGIGLTLVRQLVELHGGTISASSPGIGHGTTVTVRIPQGGVVLSACVSDSTPPQRARMGGLKVVVVDDNADAAELLTLLLESFGAQVLSALEGMPAVQLVQKCNPDLVFLDLALPDISGYEVARRIRLTNSNVKLVALTGFSHEESRAKVQRAGFDAHLIKPLRLSDLGTLLERFQLQPRPPAD